jgi:hypothetical protein
MLLAIASCNSPSATQPQDQNTITGTAVEDPIPPGAIGNGSVNYSEGAITPGEQGSLQVSEKLKPQQVAGKFADLLTQRRFGDAFDYVDGSAMGTGEKAFEHRFADYKTIDAAVGKIGPTEGAAGSLYSTVQLTLSGNKNDGTPYAMTGPVTLRRVNDVPGSTAEQRQWHIVKMELTNDPAAAKALVKH